jgi:hypothetical protein
MSDFAVNKKEDSKGIYGKRTSFTAIMIQYRETRIFYKEVKYARDSIYSKSDQYWSKTVTKV